MPCLPDVPQESVESSFKSDLSLYFASPGTDVQYTCMSTVPMGRYSDTPLLCTTSGIYIYIFIRTLSTTFKQKETHMQFQ